MKKVIAAVMSVLILISGLTACCEGVKVMGSGKLINETYEFSDFTGIKVQNGFQVEVTESSTFSVVAIVDDNVLEHIDIKKSGDTLTIRPKANRSFRSVTLSAKVTMPDIYKIELSGGAEVEINGFDSSDDLAVKLSGGSHLNGSIGAGDVNLGLSGGSHVTLSGSADNLVANGSGGSQGLASFNASAASSLNVVSFPPVTVINPLFFQTTCSLDSFEADFLFLLNTGRTPAMEAIHSFMVKFSPGSILFTPWIK